MSVSSGQPFAMRWNQVYDGAGGLNSNKSVSEYKDNAKDANASHIHMGICTNNKKTYFYCFDTGDGFSLGPLQFFGIHPKQQKNTSEKTTGVFSNGALAATAFFTPENVYVESRNTKGKFSTVGFKAKMFTEDSRKASSYNDVDNTDYFENSSERPASIQTTLVSMNDQISDQQKAHFSEILALSYEHGSLILLEGIKDVSEKEIYNIKRNFGLYYFNNVKDLNIDFGYNDKYLGVVTPIHPLDNIDKFPVLETNFELYEDTKGKKQLAFTLPNKEEIREYYVERNDDHECIKKGKPTGWDEYTLISKGTLQINIVSEEAAKGQITALGEGEGSDFKGTESMRGIYFSRKGMRITGAPYYPTGSAKERGFSDPRNAAHIRGFLEVETTKERMIETWKAKANKHSTTLMDTDPVIRTWLSAVFGTVADNKTVRFKKSKGKDIEGTKKEGKITDWSLDDIEDVMLKTMYGKKGTTSSKKTKEKKNKTGKSNVVDTDNDTSSVIDDIIPDETFTDDETDQIEQNEQNECLPFTFSKSTEENNCVVSLGDKRVSAIPYFNNQYHIVRDDLKQRWIYLTKMCKPDVAITRFTSYCEARSEIEDDFIMVKVGK
jgi:hypothetical protein